MDCRKYLSLIVLIVAFGCQKKTGHEDIEVYRLTGDDRARYLYFPSTYGVRLFDSTIFQFVIQYPSMAARGLEATPGEDEIFFIIEISNKIKRTSSLVSRAARKKDISKPGQPYHDGKIEEYEVYRNDLDKDTLQPMQITYVFKDEDGALVGVSDNGDWSRKYVVETSIEPDLAIRYLISKPLGKNFLQIDSDVKKFIKCHLEPKCSATMKAVR